jgi:hypothetical protein
MDFRYGNEYFFTAVVGAINGSINLVSMGKAIAALKDFNA